MLFNLSYDYFNSTYNYINNITLTEDNNIYGKIQGNIPDIFSPMNNNLKILELSSLNDYHTTQNSPSKVKVKKIPFYTNKDMMSANSGKKTLVLDLDETLVHSTTKKAFPNRKNIILHMKIRNINYTIYVILRPFLEVFLHEMSLCYDLYIFTASLSHYSKNLIEIIDKNKVIKQVLNRENCKFIKGLYLKDLSIFKRDLKDIIIIDNNPLSYTLNKNNGIPISTWIDDPNDKELVKLIPIMRYLSKVTDVRPVINKIINKNKTKLDFVKINKILDIHFKKKRNLLFQNINFNKNEADKFSKEGIKRNLTLNNGFINNSSINKGFIKNIDGTTIKNQYLNNNTIKQLKTIGKESIKNKFRKLNPIKGEKKKFKGLPLKIIKNKNVQNLPQIQQNTNIYNISINHFNNIQNKNTFDNFNFVNLEKINSANSFYPSVKISKEIKINKDTNPSKPKIETNYTKIIKMDLFRNIGNEINKRKTKEMIDNEKKNIYSNTENNAKYPIDSVKKNKYKKLISDKNNFFYMKNNSKVNDNNESIEVISKNQNNSPKKNKVSFRSSRSNQNNNFNYLTNNTISSISSNIKKQIKNNRIIVMKILKKPKRIGDSKLLKISSFEKFPSEKIKLNRRRITIK